MTEKFHIHPDYPSDGKRRVYFLRPVGQEGPIKIGVSGYPRARLQTFMAWSPVPLELIFDMPGTLALEREIHNSFADAFLHSEWFEATPRLLAFIADLQAGLPLDPGAPTGNVASLRRKLSSARKGTPSETISL